MDGTSESLLLQNEFLAFSKHQMNMLGTEGRGGVQHSLSLQLKLLKTCVFFLISERWCLCSLYLACIFASSAVASADHVCCDVSIKGVAAVTPCSWDNGHCDCPECDRHLASFQTIVAPPRHPTHVAFSYTCPLPGKRRQRHVFVQNHGSPQLDRKLYSFHVNMFFF